MNLSSSVHMDDDFYHAFHPVSHWIPPQTREEFLYEISLVQRELDLNRKCMDRITREVRKQGGYMTHEQEEMVFYVQDSNEDLEKSITYYEWRVTRLDVNNM